MGYTVNIFKINKYFRNQTLHSTTYAPYHLMQAYKYNGEQAVVCTNIILRTDKSVIRYEIIFLTLNVKNINIVQNIFSL